MSESNPPPIVPSASPPPSTSSVSPPQYEVELPGGGKLHLLSAEEVKMWQDSEQAYKTDYALQKTNDLILLGAILTQQLALFRAQQRINGMEAELDANNIPTGRMIVVKLKPSELQAAQTTVRAASKEIRDLEIALGIDKKSREAGGQQTVPQYVTLLKRAAHEYGVHISKRTLAYEEFAMALRTKLRILANADDEDKAYEKVTPEGVLEWSRNQLAKLEQVDKDFAKDKGKVFVGKL